MAGLREYALEADTKGFDARALIEEILEGVSARDARQVRLLYGYYDCENLSCVHAGRTAYNPLGLLTREELKELPEPSFCWLFTQQLARAMEKGGVDACAQLVRDIADGRDESAKALAYRLYTIAERKGWSAEAYAYNSLVTAWPEIQSRAAQLLAEGPAQGTLDFGETDI